MALRAPLDLYLKEFASGHGYSIPVSHSSADSTICHYKCHRSGTVGKPKVKKPKPITTDSTTAIAEPNAAPIDSTPANTEPQAQQAPPAALTTKKRKQKVKASTSLSTAPQATKPKISLKIKCPFDVEGHFDPQKKTWTLVYIDTSHNHGPMIIKPKKPKKPKTEPDTKASANQPQSYLSVSEVLCIFLAVLHC